MSFTRIKKVNGKEYRYEVTSYRDPETGKVRHRSRYLGKVRNQESGSLEPDLGTTSLAVDPVPPTPAPFSVGDRIRFHQHRGVVVAEKGGEVKVVWNGDSKLFNWYTQAECREYRFERYWEPGDVVSLVLALDGLPRQVTGEVVEVPGQPAGTLAVRWAWGEYGGVVQVPQGKVNHANAATSLPG